MKIAICGTNSFELLDKVAKHYNVEYVDVVGKPNETLNIYELAKVTYEYDDVKNVVFNGCVLDCAVNVKDMHYLDEQIILCALSNLDVIYVYTPCMTDDKVSLYHQFDEFYNGKVVDVVDLDTFVIE
jgi:hypothetical protein